MAASLRSPKVLDPGPMPRGLHRGAQSVGPGLRELRRTPFLGEVRRIPLPRTWVNSPRPLQRSRAYDAEGCSTRALMSAATTAIAAKAQNVTARPAAPATAPAVSAPKTCPTAMSRKAAPSPADGRS
jgi:hypothetical protein